MRGRRATTTRNYTKVEEIEELIGMIRHQRGASVEYGASPELLYPLQLALLLEQVPYRAKPEHDLLYSWVLRDVYKHVTRRRLRIIRVTEEPDYPGYKLAFASMVAWIRHRGIDGVQAREVLDAAIRNALDQRQTRSTPLVEFTHMA